MGAARGSRRGGTGWPRERGREARPTQGWNYNLVEVRGAGPETIYSSPTSRAESPRITPLATPSSALPGW